MYKITALKDVTVRVQILKGPATQADRVFIVNDSAMDRDLKKGAELEVTAINELIIKCERIKIAASDLPKKQGEVKELNHLLRIEALSNHI